MERIEDDSRALRMGSCFARALEMSDPKLPWAETYSDMMDSASSQFEIDEIMIESALVEWYSSKYIEIYGECNYRELEYSFPIEGTDYTWRGAVDALTVIERDKRVLVGVEDKFKARWDESDTKNLYLDDQVTSEIAGIRSGVSHGGKSYAFDVNEILYRVTLKPRLIRRKGRGKNAVPESVSDYVARCIEEVESKIEEYFLEFSVIKSNEEIEDWKLAVKADTEYVDLLRRQGVYPRHKDTCNYKGQCAHRELCSGVASAVEMYKVKDGYPGS